MTKIRHEQIFSSLQAMVDHCINADSPLPEYSRSSRKKESKGDGWAGTDSFETACELAQFGWPEGLKKIKAITKDVVPQFAALFPRQDAGEELHLDVGGAYEDPVVSDVGIDPADMVNFRSKFDTIKQGNSLQRLIIETCVSAFITPETLFVRGACILALLESLETFGFRIEVILQSTFRNPNEGDEENAELVSFRTVIKSFEEHSDYDKFAFCIANPAFLRRFMFSCCESLDMKTISDFGFLGREGYGYPHNHPFYLDPTRDFYMVRPLENKNLAETMVETVELINSRYKGMIQTVENPKLDDSKGNFNG